MKRVRPLLLMGNGKLGQSIFHFDLPAVVTCPGRSSVCEQVCYASSGRFRFEGVIERLAWNYQESQRPDFAEQVIEEIRRKGVLVVRIHVSGDFYDTLYASRWLDVMRGCRRTRFYFYTRSWRVPEIAEVLEAMAALKCCRTWYSIDGETGVPARVPLGVRLAYLQVGDEGPELADLMFRVRRLRHEPRRVGLPMLCPHETPRGRARDANCGNCGFCWR